MNAKRQRRTPGAIVEIPLSDTTKGYALTLEEPLFALYDLQVPRTASPPLTEIISAPILTRIWVMNHAVTRGRWATVGKVTVPKNLQDAPKFFKQDAINGELSLYSKGEETPASIEECQGLESAAVWDPTHVEERLRDHFLGVPNKWVMSLAIK